ncbi:MAG: sulfatase-like hydrolase/transferase [Acidimicrobiia bacterium]|nr:sulfatase-like hydrolase/transferase [Acidimicrobiia bacterium]
MSTGTQQPQPDAAVPARPARHSLRKIEVRRALELTALVGFAVALPVLGVFGEAPATFLAYRATSADIVVFGLAVAVVPAAAVVGLALLSRLAGERVRATIQWLLVGLLCGAVATDVTRGLGATATGQVAAGAAVATAAVLAYRHWSVVGQWLRYASPVPLVALVVFLAVSPTSSLVATAGSAPSTTTNDDTTEPPSVVLVVLDELPTVSLMNGEGGIDDELFPSFARLAGSSTWYRDATTVAGSTNLAMPAILTGRLPEQSFAPPPTADRHSDNLYTLLEPTHELNVHPWTVDLCPFQPCRHGDGDVDDEAAALVAGSSGAPSHPVLRLVGDAATVWTERVWPGTPLRPVDFVVTGDSDPADLARPGLEFLSSLDANDRPTLDVFHAPVPHSPWLLLPSGRHYAGTEVARGAEFLGWDTIAAAEHAIDVARTRHLLQVQWTDALLGAIIDRLDELGRWEDSLVIVTADHGTSFTPGTFLRVHEPGNEVELSWVPLFVKYPGQATSEIDDRNVLLTDLVPTIAEVTGREVRWDVDGHSLLDPPAREPGDKPLVPNEAWRFPDPDGDLVNLDVDGLADVIRAPAVGERGDALRVWRSGPHGHLLGEPADQLTRCSGPAGPSVELARPWPDVDDSDEAPLWIEGRTGVDRPMHLVAVVDGRIAGSEHTTLSSGFGTIGLLLAEPVVGDDPTTLELYEVDDEGDCIRPLPLDSSALR